MRHAYVLAMCSAAGPHNLATMTWTK